MFNPCIRCIKPNISIVKSTVVQFLIFMTPREETTMKPQLRKICLDAIHDGIWRGTVLIKKLKHVTSLSKTVSFFCRIIWYLRYCSRFKVHSWNRWHIFHVPISKYAILVFLLLEFPPLHTLNALCRVPKELLIELFDRIIRHSLEQRHGRLLKFQTYSHTMAFFSGGRAQ